MQRRGKRAGPALSSGGWSFVAFSVAACSGDTSALGTFVDTDASSPIVCGPGTLLSDHECLPVLQDAAASSSADASVVCGVGTSLSGNVCIANMPETGLLPEVNAPIESGVPVESGVSMESSAPVESGAESGATIHCGAGTYDDGGACVPSQPSLSCGAGTIAQGDICVPIGDAGGQYEVRVPSTVPADGYSAVPVLALGSVVAEAGAGPAIILALSPALGSLVNTQLMLGTLGATTYYVPCSSTDSSCTGSVQVTMALASAPTQIVATSNPMALVVPTGIGDPAPCLTGGNVLFFNGDAQDYIHPGMETISVASWQANYSTFAVDVSVSTSAQSSGATWTLDFSTMQLNQPIAAQVYVNAERAPFAASGHPGLEVTGDGRGCNTIAGSFQIETLQVNGSTLQSFTATFEQHCEAGTAALRGCVHFGG